MVCKADDVNYVSIHNSINNASSKVIHRGAAENNCFGECILLSAAVFSDLQSYTTQVATCT